MYDLVIKGGIIVDGRGGTPFSGDVGIRNGAIAAIGKTSGRARRTLDADGAIVTPGWIDAHTHYDGQVTWDDALEGSAANGVTTAVMGNCGVGFAPVRPDAAKQLIDLMEGVEDILGTALYEGMPWGEWESFPECLAYLDTRRWTMDVGAQLAHGPLRFYVMGTRATHGDANGSDVAQMVQLAEAAARAGAVGFSTSRILAHRSMSGDSVPGTFALEDELVSICRALARGGCSLFQAIPSGAIGIGPNEASGAGSDPRPLTDELHMLARISRAAGVRVNFSAFQINEEPDGYRNMLSVCASENATGAQLFPMVAPRGIGLLTCLRGYHMFMRRPTYLRLASHPFGELVAELRKPEIKRAVLSEQNATHDRTGSMDNVLPSLIEQSLPFAYPLSDPLDYEPAPDQSIQARAERSGCSAAEHMYDYLLQDGGQAVAVMFGINYGSGDLEACREMLLDPNTVTGLSDAGAHVNFVSDMSIPTFQLTHWARDRTRGAKLPLELLVHKLTDQPARVYGLGDRGVIALGRRADLNVIDLSALTVHRPVMHRDLPAGGSRFLQPASGYLATLVHGEVTREHDQDTGTRPGRVARPSCAPAG